jgi:Na+-driven multidrug efflux pump
MAAHEIGMKIKDIAYLPGSAIGVVAANLAGNHIGSGDYSSMRKDTETAMKLAVIIMGIFGIIFLLIPGQLINFFSKDPEVHSLGVIVLRIMAVYQIADAVFIVTRGTLNGINDTKFVRNMVLIGSWGIMVPVAFLFTNVLKAGVGGAWIGLTLYVVVIGTIYFIRLRKKNWATDEVK